MAFLPLLVSSLARSRLSFTASMALGVVTLCATDAGGLKRRFSPELKFGGGHARKPEFLPATLGNSPSWCFGVRFKRCRHMGVSTGGHLHPGNVANATFLPLPVV